MAGTLEAASPYPGVVTMLVESYSLNSAWSLGTVISLVLDSPSFMLFSTNDSIVRVRDLGPSHIDGILSNTSYV